MRKILLSLALITLTVAAVGSSAYALFSDTVKVQGITLSTGNADLDINGEDNITVPNVIGSLFPGFGVDNSKYFTFKLKNNSLSDITLEVKAKLTAASDAPGKGGSWEALKNVIRIKVIDLTTGLPLEMSMAEWNSQDRVFPGPSLLKNEERQYNVYLIVPRSATNTIAGMQLNNVTFELTGTQQ